MLALGDLLGGDDPRGAAEVVDVAVGVDEAGDRAIAAVLAVERQGGGRGLGRDQRVDDDDPALALDHVHVREVEAAQLVEARRHLEEAGDLVEPALPPEAGVGGVGALLARGRRRNRGPRRPCRRASSTRAGSKRATRPRSASARSSALSGGSAAAASRLRRAVISEAGLRAGAHAGLRFGPQAWGDRVGLAAAPPAGGRAARRRGRGRSAR